MEFWTRAFKDLRAQFRRNAGKRLRAIRGVLDALDGNGRDPSILHNLRFEFHKLAGAGGLYGYDELSRLAGRGEELCTSWLENASGRERANDLRLLNHLVTSIGNTLEKKAPPETHTIEAPPPRPSSEGRRVLIVDNDREVLQHLSERLAARGYEALTATTKSEALETLAKDWPDAVITDILLPDGTSYDLVEHVRTQDQGEALPILIISVVSDFLDKVEAIHCGADGYFEKPVDWENLIGRLSNLMQRSAVVPPRVLAVEEDPAQASFIELALKTADYEVRICRNPLDLEPALAEFKPELLLIDSFLSSMNGYDLVRYIRQDERYALLPVIFLSTGRGEQPLVESLKAGGDSHLQKPVTLSSLLSMVATQIGRHRVLKSMLRRDGLTRLLTHTAFMDRAGQIYRNVRREGKKAVAMAMIDLDDFKSINDRFGHPMGDRVLVGFSRLLRLHVRASDVVGRYGGEEFAMVMENLEAPDALRLLQRLLDEFTALIFQTPAGDTFTSTFSAGIAMLDPAVMDLAAWKKAAGGALDAAKDAGGCRVVLAEEYGSGR